jgi:hypothetical protein
MVQLEVVVSIVQLELVVSVVRLELVVSIVQLELVIAVILVGLKTSLRARVLIPVKTGILELIGPPDCPMEAIVIACGLVQQLICTTNAVCPGVDRWARRSLLLWK